MPSWSLFWEEFHFPLFSFAVCIAQLSTGFSN
jgi:hypothetical protein